MIIKSILGDKILVNWREIKDLQPKGVKDVQNLDDLKASILSNSFASPFVGWQDKKGDYYAIDGHTRKQALIELIEEGHSVPDLLDLQIILAGGRKEAIKILAEVYNQKQNKFKSDVLIEWLESEGVEVDTDSMNIEWVEDGGEEVLEAQEDDFDATPPEEPITVLGDLYEIGEHRLLCGDSTDSDQVAKLMNGQKADMVFTDPPYYSKQNLVIEATPKALIKGSLMGKESMFAKIYDFDQDKVLAMLNTLYIYSKINTYFCCSQEQVVFYLNYAEDLGLKYNILVWRKPNNVINKDRFSSSIEYIIRIYDTENAGLNRIANNDYYDKVKEISRYIQKDEKVHHTQKPIELVKQFVELSSLENNLLFEPFTGSGSTMVASHQLKRKCYGMELDTKYCDVIVKRMLKLDNTLKIKRNGIDCTNEWLDNIKTT